MHSTGSPKKYTLWSTKLHPYAHTVRNTDFSLHRNSEYENQSLRFAPQGPHQDNMAAWEREEPGEAHHSLWAFLVEEEENT